MEKIYTVMKVTLNMLSLSKHLTVQTGMPYS